MARFSIKAIKPTRNTLDAKKYEDAIQDGLKESANMALDDLQSATATWSHKPKFTVKTTRETVTVETDSDIFGYVNYGTKPHEIRPKNRRVLHFQQAYSPKTSPGRVASVSGGASGGFAFAKVVHHPGTEARDFIGQIKKRISQTMPDIIKRKLRAIQ